MAKGKKTGGRQKGSPNKDNPLRGYLREHSEAYFAPNPNNEGSISDFANDLAAMAPRDRADAQIKLLEYHTAKLRSVDVDMAITDTDEAIDQRLARLAGEQ
jgi:hypothetical protein